MRGKKREHGLTSSLVSLVVTKPWNIIMKTDCVVRLTSVSKYGKLCRQNNLFNINSSTDVWQKTYTMSSMGPKSFQTVQIFSIIQMFDKRLSPNNFIAFVKAQGQNRTRQSTKIYLDVMRIQYVLFKTILFCCFNSFFFVL